MQVIKKIFTNPVTLWIKRLFIAAYYQYKFSSKNLSIRYMVRLINCQFGHYNTIYDECDLIDVTLGDFSYIGGRSKLEKVTIGKFSCIASDVIIGLGIHPARGYVSTHPAFYSPNLQTGFTFASKSYFQEHEHCNIGNDVWIGARAIVLDGISIGDGAIVGAGAVVTKDVPAYAIVGGIPAKILRYRFDQSDIEYLHNFKWWDRDIEWLHENYERFHDVKKFRQQQTNQ